ncbi:MAG: thioesterase, FlK family [Hyphomicrobiales bacterium]
MKPLNPGLSLRQSFEVTAADTAAAIGNAGVEVISTMALVRLVEEACYGVVQACYDDGDATVGTRVALDHVGAAHPGRPVEILATLSNVSGRRLTFQVEVEQDGKRIMSGEHVRAVVALEAFLGAAAAHPAGAGPEVEFFFDYHSPWCYFASFRIGNMLRRHGGTVRWRPVHLPNMMERIDGRRPLDGIASFVKWFQQDIADHAELHGLPLDKHRDYPLRPSRALRASLYAEEQGAAEPFVQTVMRAYWAEQRDISDIAVLQELGAAAGLAPDGIAEAAGSESYKAQVAANVEEAAERGVFGLPAMFFEGKLFWGNDRLDLLDRWIGKATAK